MECLSTPDAAMGRTYVYDIEIYPNFFVAIFKQVDTDKEIAPLIFTDENFHDLQRFLDRPELTLAGYNNFNFDDPLLATLRFKPDTSMDALYAQAQLNFSKDPKDQERLFELRWGSRTWTCIDLMAIMGGTGRAGSLKSHEVRLGLLNVQDLPIAPGTVLSEEQKAELTAYCLNDIHATEQLYLDTQNKIAVRHAVNARFPHLNGSALRRSDASIAERVMKSEMERRTLVPSWERRVAPSYQFNPEVHIEAGVQFISEKNREMLARLRDLPPFEAEEWKSLCGRFSFRIGDHNITLGAGGVHTLTAAMYICSSTIVEFDVASYYPSLLQKIDAPPSSLTRDWLAILAELTRERLAAKRASDKSTADVYKIIINSIYGKLLDKSSLSYDPALQLRVVINGQLFLCQLMECFHNAGFHVIAGNTDGVYIDAGDRMAEAKAIAEQWMTDTGLTLESKTASMFVASSINDYALFNDNEGWFHRKGRLDVGSRTRPAVIADAVLQSLSTGKPVEDYIRQHNNLIDFLYSSSVRRSDEVRHADQPVQHTNRWYIATDGLPIERRKPNDDAKWSRVSNSESSRLANRLTDLTLPTDLDIDHYIEQATVQLQNIVGPTTVPITKPAKLIAAALKAQALGLAIVPKGRPRFEKSGVPKTYDRETINYWLTTPLDQADWMNYIGFGTYTGAQFNVIGIDIDNPVKAKEAGLFELLTKRGITAWHGDATAADVREGRRRGTVLFHYSGNDLRSTGSKFFQSYGFEILYGNEVAQLAGLHPDGDTYRYKGKLVALPAALRDKLTWLMPDDDLPRTNSESGQDHATLALLEQFLTTANADEQYIAAGGELQWASTAPLGSHLVGRCVGHEHHSQRQQESAMTVRIVNGAPRVNCFHQSCSEVVQKWRRKITEQLVVIKRVAIKAENLVVHEDARDIAVGLQDTTRYKLIIAPTGSGKTHNIVTHIALHLGIESESEDTFAIICSSKDQMRQLGERFATVLESDNINELGIDLIEASASLKIGNAISREATRSTTRVAITHYTYVSRQKFNTRYYAFLNFIREDTHVFIDEIDAFVESQTATGYRLGGRFRRVGRDGRYKHMHMHRCGMFHGNNNCLNCVMRAYDANRLTIDDFHNISYQSIPEFMDGVRQESLPHIDVESRKIASLQVGNSEITMLHAPADPEDFLEYEAPIEGLLQQADFREIFEDHINSSYLPTVHRPIITYDGVEVSREELIARFRQDEKFLIPEAERKRLRFPSRACNVLTVTMIDRRPILRMAKARSVTGLTATLSPGQERFLGDMLPGVKRITIPPADNRKMDKIIVVGMERKIPLKVIIRGQWTFEKLFRYRETQAMAVKDFEALTKSGIPIRMGFAKDKFMLSSDEHEYGHHKILQTYSFGSLGRGIDFAEYDIVDVNTDVYKPIAAFVTDDPVMLKQQILEDRATTIVQNVGRILRREPNVERAVKIVILEELNAEEELLAIAQRFEAMSREPVDFWWVPPFIDHEEVGQWLTAIGEQRLLPPALPRGVDDLRARARKLIDEGCDKKAIKQQLRWVTIRQSMDDAIIDQVEVDIDRLLAERPADVRRTRMMTPERIAAQRKKRFAKMRELHQYGQTAGKIRSNMKVYNGSRPWPEVEQQWFESMLTKLQSQITEPDGVESTKT